MKTKLTQQQAIFYQLYYARKKDPLIFVPVWKLIGEVYVKEYGRYKFVSYEVSARMSEMFKENPRLFERTKMTGISGAKYYGYRLRVGCTPEDIVKTDLKAFYSKVYFSTAKTV